MTVAVPGAVNHHVFYGGQRVASYYLDIFNPGAKGFHDKGGNPAVYCGHIGPQPGCYNRSFSHRHRLGNLKIPSTSAERAEHSRNRNACDPYDDALNNQNLLPNQLGIQYP